MGIFQFLNCIGVLSNRHEKFKTNKQELPKSAAMMQNICLCNELAGSMNLCKTITETVILKNTSIKGHKMLSATSTPS